jgi:hypothetical protein
VKAPENISPRQATIEVYIDTLVVDGLAVRNAAHLGVVVQNELQGLLAEHRLSHFAHSIAPGAHLELATLRTPSIRTPRVPDASDAGEKIARAIHGGLRA